MLNYTSLFADLEALFANAGRDPASFRRLAREVGRVGESLAEYCSEVSTDYVIRLQQRLGQKDAQLSAEEVNLLRSFLGLAPPDPERDQRLVDDLARLEENLQKALQLKDRPLSLKNLDDLRRLLDRMGAVLPRIVAALEEREEIQRFERAVGQSESGELDRVWLQRRIRRALAGSDLAAAPSEESTSSFGTL